MALIANADALALARDVLEKKDARGFAKIAEALGLDLPFETFHAYVEKHAKSPYANLTKACGAGGLQLMLSALTSEHGHAMEVVYGQTILVAKRDGFLVYAMQDGAPSQPFKKWGWRIAPRWYKDPARNRQTIENWLDDPARERDALTIPITRAFEAAPADDRGAALLAAVCADPEDVAARLVYADWLVEREDRRGELIRVQCDLAEATGDRRQALEARSAELERAYTTTMLEPIKRFVDRAKIHRGLIEEIDILGDRLIKHGARLVAQHPITKLRVIVKDAAQFGKLAALPWIGNIADVTYEGREQARVIYSGAKLEVSAAGGTAMFAKTKRLAFADVKDSPAQWAKLYGSIVAPCLEWHGVSEGLDDEAVAALARCKLPALRTLELERLAKSALSARVLAKLSKHTLVRVHCDFWPRVPTVGPCIAALLSPTVRELRLNRVHGTGLARALADRGERLEMLELLCPSALSLAEIAELLAKQKLPRLRTLVVKGIDGDEVDAEAFTRALCAAPACLASVRWEQNLSEGTTATAEQHARIVASGRRYPWMAARS